MKVAKGGAAATVDRLSQRDGLCHYLHQHTEPSPISPFSNQLASHLANQHNNHQPESSGRQFMKTSAVLDTSPRDPHNNINCFKEDSSEDMFERDEASIIEPEEEKKLEHTNKIIASQDRSSYLHLSRHLTSQHTRSQHESSVRSTVAPPSS